MSFLGFRRGDDQDPASVWSVLEKKHRKAVKDMEEPILPPLCRILFACMLISTAAVLGGEVVTYFRYAGTYQLDPAQCLFHAAYSALVVWALFSLALILCSLAALFRLMQGHGETLYFPSEDERYASRQWQRRRLKNIDPTNLNYRRKKYYLYLAVSLAGLAVFGTVYFVFMPAV